MGVDILAMDISGNYGEKEGYGTTGFCQFDGEPTQLGDIKAKGFKSQMQYWDTHLDLISICKPEVVVIEGYRLYNHRGMSADTQSNSEFPTSQLIGLLKHWCWVTGQELRIQYAKDIKTRWSEKVLVGKGILELRNGRYYFKDSVTNAHQRDALKHALQFSRYGKK